VFLFVDVVIAQGISTCTQIANKDNSSTLFTQQQAVDNKDTSDALHHAGNSLGYMRENAQHFAAHQCQHFLKLSL